MEISRELDYQKRELTHPYYKYIRKNPQSQQTQTVNASGGQELLIQTTGSDTINFSKSKLCWSVLVPREAVDSYVNIHAAGIPYFRQVSLYGDATNYIIDVSDNDVYSRVVSMTDLKLTDMLSNDLVVTSEQRAAGIGTSAGVLADYKQTIGNGLRRNNTLPADAVAQDSRPCLAEDGTTAGQATMAYTEPLYAIRGNVSTDAVAAPNTVGARGDCYVDYAIPLSMICKNSFFSLDKDFYFPRVMNLRFTFNRKSKISWLTTGGANTSYVLGAADLTHDIAISNFHMKFAIEQDIGIQASLKEKVMSPGGMNVIFPYVHCYKRNAGVASTQSINYIFTRYHGSNLFKIYHTLTSNTETLNNAYNMNNIAEAKLLQYYTALNGKRIQDSNIDIVQQEDWTYMKDKLLGSVSGQSVDLYRYNWVNVDKFGDGDHPLCEDDKVYNSQLLTGVDLSTDQTFDFNGVNMVAAAYNHYTFAIALRMLNINANGFAIM